MIPPIFPVCIASAQVVSIFGSPPYTRIYPFGLLDESIPQRPYLVWQTIGGFPENFINQRPDTDTYTTQVDVYADTSDQALEAAQALRDAIEGRAHITRWGDQEKEDDTKLYRYSFDVDWIVPRPR